jgi:hypothetical protein
MIIKLISGIVFKLISKTISMKPTIALGSGLAGAAMTTLIHETVKRVVPNAPRMDLLGMTALSKMLKNADKNVPGRSKLYGWTLAGDIVSNSLYYSLAGIGKTKGAVLRGGLLGLAAGIGAVLLPKPLGLNEEYSNRTTSTKLMTIGLYLAGGLITAAVLRALHKRQERADAEYAYMI